MQRSQILMVNDGTGALAKGATQLKSIAQFYDANGTFILETPQALTVTGNARSTSISMDGQMSLDRLAAAIQNALVSSSGLDIANSKASLVNTSQTGVAELGGYLQIISGSIGDPGVISFSADQPLIDALGLSSVRDSKNSLVELTSRDAFGNVNQIRTDDDIASGLLSGIDVQFSSQPAQVAGYGGLETGLSLTGIYDSDFNMKVAGTTYGIHIHEGTWTMEGLSRCINTQFKTNNISGARSAVVDGEIEIFFEPTKASVSSTFEISRYRLPPVADPNTIGFVEGEFSGFTRFSKKAGNAEYGFSRYATNAATVRFVVSDGENAPATVSFTTINTLTSDSPDLLSFASWQQTANETLKLSNVDVRVDAANGALAFTSLRVGSENMATGTTASYVSVTIVDPTNGKFISKFGLETTSSAVGSGDKNFRMHVVDTASQFQIGADEGQRMRISISDMSSKALGVENLDLTRIAGAQKSLVRISRAIDKVAAERARLGTFQDRLEYSVKNLNTEKTSHVAAESNIRDVDMALEMVEFTRDKMVTQSGTAMMAQANLLSQSVLRMLKK
ncbi:MAG TPA: flagellin, partial [Candidatus Ozemobacteraceae bacterium]|nr:flagellin [Candidatus Ozemobacteraceae bacterium]